MRIPRQSAEAKALRAKVVSWWEWAVRHRDQINYAEVRPMASRAARPGQLPLTMDCSETITTFTRWSRGPDPNGMNYAGYGNTDTIAGHLRQIRQVRTRRGDICIFGFDGRTVHGVQLLQGGFWRRDPLVGSHGNPDAPEIMPLSRMSAGFQGLPRRFYRLVPYYWKG